MYWALVTEGTNNLTIRRYHDGKNLRLPRKQYKHLLGNNEALQILIIQLNYPLVLEAQKRDVELNRVFNTQKHLDTFLEEIRLKQRTDRSGDYQVSILRNYYFTYFSANNVRTFDEFEEIETRYYLYLIEELRLKYKTIKYIVQTINRYHSYLERLSKKEGQLKKYHQFDLRINFPKNKYDALNINNKTKRIFVPQSVFEKLLEIASPLIHSHLKLAYKLGLRRGESVAIEEDNLYENFVEITQALDSDGNLSTPKSTKKREIGYHYISPRELVQIIRDRNSISVDTVSKLTKIAVDKLMELKVITQEFDFHSLRGSFCTIYMKDIHKFGKSYEDVRVEMGHADIRTTMSYLYNTNTSERKKFVMDA